jgi:hypothetical protein
MSTLAESCLSRVQKHRSPHSLLQELPRFVFARMARKKPNSVTYYTAQQESGARGHEDDDEPIPSK